MQGIGGTGQKNLPEFLVASGDRSAAAEPEARPAPERVIGHLTEVVSCAEMR